jgi:hypothetical protein
MQMTGKVAVSRLLTWDTSQMTEVTRENSYLPDTINKNGVTAENRLHLWQTLQMTGVSYVRFGRQVSGFLQLLRSFVKFVRDVSGFMQSLRFC